MPDKHTPANVITAIRTVAAYLDGEHYGSAIVAPSGGASFHLRNILDEKADLFAEIARLHTDLEAARSALKNVQRIARLGDVNIQPLLLPILDAAARGLGD